MNTQSSLVIDKSWISSFHWEKSPRGSEVTQLAHIIILGKDDKSQVQKLVMKHAQDWQKEEILNSPRDLIYFQGSQGPVWILRPRARDTEASSDGRFDSESAYAISRDLCGALVPQLRAHPVKRVCLEFMGAEAEVIRGSLIGFELGAYQFRNHLDVKSRPALPAVYVKCFQSPWTFEGLKEKVQGCEREAQAINLARHLVNLPPNLLNPVSFIRAVKALKWSSSTKIEVWNLLRLKKEKMNLHVAVGQGAASPPSLLHIRYRPKKKGRSKSEAPLAFVGKGLTFDSGGLDLKTSAGMRLMKKDMGGAAAVLALAHWVSSSEYSRPCDFYLCLAENSVDAEAFRPSDVICSRAGFWVEIDNTDAEGRLVLADGLDVAVTQKETPEIVIDVATLTGAIKVGLGAEVSGLFCNDDDLANELYQAGRRSGDYCWRMPLVERYFSSLSSSFADFKNSGEGFGGAITAALFLQKFVGRVKWAHLDIYAWTDKSRGALAQPGGNGQAVQGLIEFLKVKAPQSE